jgi:GT2 family glycosyltransferase
VVDDGPTDGTAEVVSRFPRARLVTRPSSGGFARAVNDGAAVARGEFLLLVNNDVLVPADAVSELESALAAMRPEVFAAVPRIIRPDGSDESLLRCRFELGLARTGAGRGTAYPSGACCMVRSGAWRLLGGFSTVYSPAYWEDVDLGLRAAAAGLSTARIQGLSVEHRHSASFGSAPGVGRLRERNRFILMHRHFGSPGRRVETAALFPLHAVAAILGGRGAEFLGGWLDFLAWRRRNRDGSG